MHLWITAVVWGLSCTPPSSSTELTDTGPTQLTSTDTPTTATRTSDEAQLRDAIVGKADAQDTLEAIANSGGLPVQTSTGSFLFACLCPAGDWLLTGDFDDWTGQPMARTGALSWIEVEIPEPIDSRYKFTNNTDWIADPLARRYAYDAYGELSLVRASAAHLERWIDIQWSELAPRDLQIWVPDQGRFSHILYAHDGQNLFDPAAIWGGWRLDESLPDEILVVGIDNTADRISEYTHTSDLIHGKRYGGDGTAYAQLVEETIRPLVEEHYGSADTVGLLGSSLGGLISFYIPLVYPDRYDMAISLSGTMGWGSLGTNNPTLIEEYAQAGHQSTALYLDSGGGGSCLDTDADGIADDGADNADNYCENLQLRDVLSEDLGYTFEQDLWHWHEPEAPHNEQAWAARVWRPLEIFATQ